MADTPVAPTPIGAWPTAPQRTDEPATFVTRSDAWVAATPTRSTEMNAIATNVNFNATSAFDSAAEALASSTTAVNAKNAAEAASNAVEWVSGTTYAVGLVVWSPIDFLSYRRKTAGAGTTDPSLDATNWASLLPSSSEIIRTARTSNVELVAADSGGLTDVTSGTFTQTFAAASVLGDGWFRYYQNSGTGDVTLDPFGAETIDGLTSFIMYPGEVRLIQCDSTALRSVVLKGFSKTFTASGTFTKPPGYQQFSGLAWSAGASGGNAVSGNNVFGGGGGGCFNFELPASSVGTTETITIGAGGLGVATGNLYGNSGGDTTLGSLLTVYGAVAASKRGGSVLGDTASATATPDSVYASPAQGSSSNDLRSAYSGGVPHTQGNQPVQGQLWGGAPGGSIGNPSILRGAGTSLYGGDGGAAVLASNGTDGTAPGGGGGATESGTLSGAGARGEIRIRGVV